MATWDIFRIFTMLMQLSITVKIKVMLNYKQAIQEIGKMCALEQFHDYMSGAMNYKSDSFYGAVRTLAVLYNKEEQEVKEYLETALLEHYDNLFINN